METHWPYYWCGKRHWRHVFIG